MDRPDREIAEKVIRKKRGSEVSPVIGDNGISVEPGDCSKIALAALEFLSWGEVDKSSVPAMEERFRKYVQYCAEHDLKIGNQACYAAIGIDKDDVYDWTHGRSRSSTHSDFIKKVQKFCAFNREMLMQDSKVNPVVGIFWQKNYDGLKDIQDVTLTPGSPLGEAPDQKQLEERIAGSVIVDDE